ncbi:unnamed protein product [Prorocentrum cordatum]|uniref:Glycosyl transferase family 1 domain-containing protein n=1 Tax=Prorocentrum cordatum TaxID=2364126 RepID=A0ABN9SLA2_9DINO|nr:unnamed protein product [Polarella glacialis]
MRAAYAACDLVVSASRFETLGNVVVEAFAAGTPVAVQPAQGHLEFVEHGRNSYHVDFDDPAAARPQLEEIVRRLLSGEDRALRAALDELGVRLRSQDFAVGLEDAILRPALAAAAARRRCWVLEPVVRCLSLVAALALWLVVGAASRLIYAFSREPRYEYGAPGSAVEPTEHQRRRECKACPLCFFLGQQDIQKGPGARSLRPRTSMGSDGGDDEKEKSLLARIVGVVRRKARTMGPAALLAYPCALPRASVGGDGSFYICLLTFTLVIGMTIGFGIFMVLWTILRQNNAIATQEGAAEAKAPADIMIDIAMYSFALVGARAAFLAATGREPWQDLTGFLLVLGGFWAGNNATKPARVAAAAALAPVVGRATAWVESVLPGAIHQAFLPGLQGVPLSTVASGGPRNGFIATAFGMDAPLTLPGVLERPQPARLPFLLAVSFIYAEVVTGARGKPPPKLRGRAIALHLANRSRTARPSGAPLDRGAAVVRRGAHRDAAARLVNQISRRHCVSGCLAPLPPNEGARLIIQGLGAPVIAINDEDEACVPLLAREGRDAETAACSAILNCRRERNPAPRGRPPLRAAAAPRRAGASDGASGDARRLPAVAANARDGGQLATLQFLTDDPGAAGACAALRRRDPDSGAPALVGLRAVALPRADHVHSAELFMPSLATADSRARAIGDNLCAVRHGAGGARHRRLPPRQQMEQALRHADDSGWSVTWRAARRQFNRAADRLAALGVFWADRLRWAGTRSAASQFARAGQRSTMPTGSPWQGIDLSDPDAICRVTAEDRAHFHSKDHKSRCGQQRADGWPDPSLFDMRGNLWKMAGGTNVDKHTERTALRFKRGGWGPEWRFNGANWQAAGDAGPWTMPCAGAPMEWPVNWGQVPKSYPDTYAAPTWKCPPGTAANKSRRRLRSLGAHADSRCRALPRCDMGMRRSCAIAHCSVRKLRRLCATREQPRPRRHSGGESLPGDRGLFGTQADATARRIQQMHARLYNYSRAAPTHNCPIGRTRGGISLPDSWVTDVQNRANAPSNVSWLEMRQATKRVGPERPCALDIRLAPAGPKHHLATKCNLSSYLEAEANRKRRALSWPAEFTLNWDGPELTSWHVIPPVYWVQTMTSSDTSARCCRASLGPPFLKNSGLSSEDTRANQLPVKFDASHGQLRDNDDIAPRPANQGETHYRIGISPDSSEHLPL